MLRKEIGSILTEMGNIDHHRPRYSSSHAAANYINCTDLELQWRRWHHHHHPIQQSSRAQPRFDFCADTTADFRLPFRPIVDVDENGENRAALTSQLPRSASFHGYLRQNQHLPTAPLMSSWRDHESLSGEFELLRRGASQPNLQQMQHLMDFQDVDVDLEKGIIMFDVENGKKWKSQERWTLIPVTRRTGSSFDNVDADRRHPSGFGKRFVIPVAAGAVIDGIPSANVAADIGVDDTTLPSTMEKTTSTAVVVCRQQLYWRQSYNKSEPLPLILRRPSNSAPSSCVDVIKMRTSSAVDLPEWKKWKESDDLRRRVELPEPPTGAGPELQQLEVLEDDDDDPGKLWQPFLLRFPVSCFGICLGLGSQSILWKTISAAAATSMGFLHRFVPAKHINLTFWCAAMAALLLISATYSVKCFAYSGAVRREFRHPVRSNFFFAPWIAGMFLLLGLPSSTGSLIDAADPLLWAMLMAPVLALELKIYGQWLSGGGRAESSSHRRLSEMANPTTHLSIVGNFVGALVAAAAGLTEAAVFCWAVGVAHYVVLFVTLYQRLPTAMALPPDLHPVFFMFVSAPCTASVAWSQIVGDFDLVSRLTYFVGLFLYASLVFRVKFFCGFRFSIAWWAYTFPMTATAIATIHYSLKVDHVITKAMAVMLSLVSTVTVLSLCVVTLQHILRGTMFPNDMAIAIAADSINKTNKISIIKEGTSESSSSRNIVISDDIITGYGNVKGGKQASESWVNGCL